MITTEQSLERLFRKRAWYKNSGIKESTARVYKKRFIDNTLEMETRMKILKTCGFKLVQEMQWEEEMNREQIKADLTDKLHREDVFWFYDPGSTTQITDEILIEKVLLHLDVNEITDIFRLFPKKRIQAVWKEKLLPQEPIYHNLNRFYAFLFFNIKNPDRYIRDHINKRIRSIRCKD
jgi:hypothetical protein